MKKEKQFHANEYEPGKFICKVQVKGVRTSHYGKTEEEAIEKARKWYHEQIQKLEDNIIIEEIKPDTNNDNKNIIIKQLDKIGSILEQKEVYKTDDIYITVQEAQNYLKISQGQMYKILHQPDFPRQKIGRTYRILFSELKEYMKKHRFSQI